MAHSTLFHASTNSCRHFLDTELVVNNLAPITAFRGDYAFLSNFFVVPVLMEGVTYSSVEHGYQAAKTVNPIHRKQIAAAATPALARQLGKQVTLRRYWDRQRDIVMLDLLRYKFAHPELAALLVATQMRMLLEGNTWGDKYWGVVRTAEGWSGKNRLGNLLMKIRAELTKKSRKS